MSFKPKVTDYKTALFSGKWLKVEVENTKMSCGFI